MFGRYAEEAEHAFMRSLGVSSFQRAEDGSIHGFPRLGVRSEFRRPVSFEDLLEIHLWISHVSQRSLEYCARFSHQGEEVARLRYAVACCHVLPDGRLRPMPLPESLRERIEVADRERLSFRER